MVRCFLLILLLPLFGRAQKFTTQDVKQLKLFSAGVFSNDAQVKTDTGYRHAVLKLQPLWQKRKDGAWLLAERKDTGHQYQVWHFYLQDDTTLVMQLLDFKEPQKALQVSQDIKQQANLYLYNLFTRHGCEVYLKKNKAGYSGSSMGKECFSDEPGIEYLLFNIAFTKKSISWQQLAYDKKDNEVKAGKADNYIFIKQVK